MPEQNPVVGEVVQGEGWAAADLDSLGEGILTTDAHGMIGVGRYVWSADRAGNNVEIIDTLSNFSVGSIDLVTEANQDPAPDLMDVAPDGQYVFVGLRGPNPLTGNDKVAHNAKGTIPGVGVIANEPGRACSRSRSALLKNIRA